MKEFKRIMSEGLETLTESTKIEVEISMADFKDEGLKDIKDEKKIKEIVDDFIKKNAKTLKAEIKKISDKKVTVHYTGPENDVENFVADFVDEDIEDIEIEDK